ncbi:S-layer homology domain-containing protein [Paenibacillus sp. FSL W8-0194]|uniref:S-layer homology domain-containing protein n=1 Tax=Paenibacillus sp. FSL W8-0194 TaxID=2921711 RepID=UPI0030DD32FC
MKKTWTVTALSFALLVSAAGSALASASFRDIGESGAKQQIEALQAKGVVTGVAADRFAPGERLLLAQGMAMIARGLLADAPAGDDKTGPGGAYFTSIPADAWYHASFVAAHDRGLDLPADADPAGAVTKEQFVHYVMQALESTKRFPMINLVPAALADEDQLTVEYQGTIQRALHYGLVDLDESGRFHPQTRITREDAASILYKAIALYEKQAKTNDPTKPQSSQDSSK